MTDRSPLPGPPPSRVHTHAENTVPYESAPFVLTEMPPLTTPQLVMDGGREVRFTGGMIAFASSERAFAPRFTEFRLFKTSKSMYVVSRIGISRVFHASDCSQAQAHRLPFGSDLAVIPSIDQMSPCSLCKPSRTAPLARLRFERERPWAGIADNAQGVIQLLTQNSTHGMSGSGRSITQLGARLLTDASRIDPDIRAAYQRVEL